MFVSEITEKSKICTLFKNAVIELSNNNHTNAGICPKSDTSIGWRKPMDGVKPTFKTKDTKFWCKKNRDIICTFPFSFNDQIYYKPFKQTDGKLLCGTWNSLDLLTYGYVGDGKLVESDICQGKRQD